LPRVVAGALFALLLAAGAPASAHTRVFIGAGFGVPAYGAPYAYAPYGYPYPYAYPYPYYGGYYYGGGYGVPPPGWEPGHWEWRRDAGGRSIQVWTPPYLR
jgi:hypothetical protein